MASIRTSLRKDTFKASSPARAARPGFELADTVGAEAHPTSKHPVTTAVADAKAQQWFFLMTCVS
jgi:hypothetical protein